MPDTPRSFQLVAGHVALDFANTLDNRFGDQPEEMIKTYGDLLAFCRQAGSIAEQDRRSLARRIEEAEGQRAARAARRLREAIYFIFQARASEREADAESLAILNEHLRMAFDHRVLTQASDGFDWQWNGLDRMANGPLWPIALAAGELLTANELTLVRECQSDTCRWLFLDLSKNHSRRWCDMKLCGNRTKARRYYRKHSER